MQAPSGSCFRRRQPEEHETVGAGMDVLVWKGAKKDVIPQGLWPGVDLIRICEALIGSALWVTPQSTLSSIKADGLYIMGIDFC